MIKTAAPKPRCLIVEDDEDCRWVVMRALMKLEFQCDTARDGEQALKLLSKDDYHVVVTDLRMPNKHGFSLASDLKKKTGGPAIVVYTGVEEPKLVAQLYSLGVDDVCIKPISPDVLAAKINAVFQKWLERNSGNLQAGSKNLTEAAPVAQEISKRPRKVVKLASIG